VPENGRLNRVLIEVELAKIPLKDPLSREEASPHAKHAAVTALMSERSFGMKRVCGLAPISRSRYGWLRPMSIEMRAIPTPQYAAENPKHDAFSAT
jgi:hypothetical protein